MRDPNKIMGLPKWAFWLIIAGGVILAWYIWRSNKLNTAAAGTAPTDTTQGLTAADIGGTPADNSFATNTDLTAVEEQIQQLQNSLFQLQQANGGNGAGLPGGDRGGSPVNIEPTNTQGFGGDITGTQSGGGQVTTDGGRTSTSTSNVSGAIGFFGPGGGGIYYPPPSTVASVEQIANQLPPPPPAYKSGTALAY